MKILTIKDLKKITLKDILDNKSLNTFAFVLDNSDVNIDNDYYIIRAQQVHVERCNKIELLVNINNENDYTYKHEFFNASENLESILNRQITN